MNHVITDIIAERAIQYDKGFTASHDDSENDDGQLIDCASLILGHPRFADDSDYWPVQRADHVRKKYHSHSDRRKQLVIAAALIVAEIERMDRLSRQEGGQGHD
jgi:hypothetical protein